MSPPADTFGVRDGGGMRSVIVVYGGSGHGKDALSDMLADELGRDRTLRCAFADPLKSAAMVIFGMPREVAYGSQADKLAWKWHGGLTARDILQKLGTEAGRQVFGPWLWVNALAGVIRSQPQGVSFAVVSDGRFYTERDLGDRLPGVEVRKVLVWRPTAPDLGLPPTTWNRIRVQLSRLPLLGRLFGAQKLMHPSESEVWDMRRRVQRGERLFDDFVVNDGTLEDLRAKARAIAAEVS